MFFGILTGELLALGSVILRTMPIRARPDEVEDRDIGPFLCGFDRMHTRAVENPISIRNIGTKNASRCLRCCFSTVPSSVSKAIGGTAIAAIIENKRNRVKIITIVMRTLAMSWYLRKYFRSVMSAARCEEEERAQMYRIKAKCAPWTSKEVCPT